VQHDGICLQQGGEEVRGDRDAARGNDDGPNILERQSALWLSLDTAYDVASFAPQNATVLEDMENVVAHSCSIHPAKS
jgi:hypothetical protein